MAAAAASETNWIKLKQKRSKSKSFPKALAEVKRCFGKYLQLQHSKFESFVILVRGRFDLKSWSEDHTDVCFGTFVEQMYA